MNQKEKNLLLVAVVFFATFIVPTKLFGQSTNTAKDTCSSILDLGIYNTTKNYSSRELKKYVYDRNCGSSSKSTSIGLFYKKVEQFVGYKSGEGAGGDYQNSKDKQWCKEHSDLKDSSSIDFNRIDEINNESLKEYNKCIELAKSNSQISIDLDLTSSLSYLNVSLSTEIELKNKPQLMYIQYEGMSCDVAIPDDVLRGVPRRKRDEVRKKLGTKEFGGYTVDAKTGVVKVDLSAYNIRLNEASDSRNSAIKVSCRRSSPTQRTSGDFQNIKWPRGVLIINTSAGENGALMYELDEVEVDKVTGNSFKEIKSVQEKQNAQIEKLQNRKAKVTNCQKVETVCINDDNWFRGGNAYKLCKGENHVLQSFSVGQGDKYGCPGNRWRASFDCCQISLE